MLTRGAAAEVVAGDQDLGVLVGGLVEHEVRVDRAVLVVARFCEKSGAEAGALDRLQVILRNDHVRVDVDDGEGGGDTGELDEFFHNFRPSISEECCASV
ncbi:hypothetical protein D3C87_1738420 [compost metagenome]